MYLTPYLLRKHFFVHGLHGAGARGGFYFLESGEVSRAATEDSEALRQEHLSGKLLRWIWSLEAVYTMVNVNVWNERCREAVWEQVNDRESLGAICLMLFGRGWMSGWEFVESFVGVEKLRGALSAIYSQPFLAASNADLQFAIDQALNRRI